VALDLPGFGLSDKPMELDYTIGKFVEVIVGFMYEVGMVAKEADKEKISNNNKVSIVGHSLGGYIAAQLAIEHPDLVDKLVLIDASGMLNGPPTPLLQQYLDAAMNPTRENVRAVFEQLAAAPIRISDALVYGFIHRISQPGSKHAFKSAYDNSVYTQIGTERLKQIGDSNIPTLLIWGRQDNLIPLKYFKIFEESIKGSQIVIVEDAGHAPFSEKPAIVTELLRKFLSVI
jgi:pimeloyl-ACP methyl ester carboxylesterase